MRIFRLLFVGFIFFFVFLLNTSPIFSQQEEDPPPDDDLPIAGSNDCKPPGRRCKAEVDDGQGGSFTVVGSTVVGEDGYIYITTDNGSTFIIGQAQSGGGNGGGGETGGGNTGGGGGQQQPPPAPPPPEIEYCFNNSCPTQPPGVTPGQFVCNQYCYSNDQCSPGLYCRYPGPLGETYVGTCRNISCPNEDSCLCPGVTNGPTLACNQSCTGGNQCTSGYCHEGLCREAACPDEASCWCGNEPPTSSPTTDPGKVTVGPGTNTPTAGPTTNTPTPLNTPECTISALANPTTVNSGQTSTISWTTTNAVGNCTLNGAGYQATGSTNDSKVTGTLTPYNSSFNIICQNSQGESCQQNITINVSVIAACNNTCRFDNECPSGTACLTVGASKICRNPTCANDGDCNCATTNTPTGPATPTPEPNCNAICRGDYQCTPLNPAYVCSGGLCRRNACPASTNCICGAGPTTNTPTPPGWTPPVTPVEPPYACFRTGCVGNGECLAPADACLGGTCVNIACTAESDCICGPGPGTDTYTLTPPGSGAPRTITGGTVYSDSRNNDCTGGEAPLANVQIQVVNDATNAVVGTPRTSDASGAYASINANGVDDAHVILSNIGAGQVVKGVKDSATGSITFSGTYTPGAGYAFDWEANPSRAMDFCIGNGNVGWYQTSIGDVRYLAVDNPVQNGLASNSNPASNIFSSKFNSVIPERKVSATGWQVNREYSEYNSVNTLGSTSYSFYVNQTTRSGITPQTVAGSLPTTLTTGPSESQGFYLKQGNLTINQNTNIPAGNTVILLVNGDVDIQSNITVANGAIFILAASGNITVHPGVGVPFTNDDVTTAPLQGVYTAERNIVILSNPAACPTADLRLNVSGTLIANSLRPFATNGSGRVINNRTLCLDNRNYPSLKVYQRASFATGLTTILKSQSRRWSESN